MPSDMPNILVLGGTTEATMLVHALTDARLRATLSFAGRVARPKPQPVPVRSGGFGGVAGLVDYLRDHAVTHLVDATHPYAAQMSRHAVGAAQSLGIPLAALTRPPWQPEPGDNLTSLPDMAAAVAALAGPPRRVMLAIGRMHLAEFTPQPQHHYLLRLVDPPDTPPPLPDHHIILDRGPFSVAGDRTLLRGNRIEVIVSKNAGGTGAQAKLIAARELRLPVLMIDRPALPARLELGTVQAILDWIAAH